METRGESVRKRHEIHDVRVGRGLDCGVGSVSLALAAKKDNWDGRLRPVRPVPRPVRPGAGADDPAQAHTGCDQTGTRLRNPCTRP